MEIAELVQKITELEATISTLKIQFWGYVFASCIVKVLYSYFY